MSLPKRQLDTLRYDRLLADALDLLPYRAPAWTDHNAHDPGITLLELLAWLTEANSYRLDRLSPPSERAFLRLIGIEPKPAQIARTLLAFHATTPTPLATRLQVCSADGSIRFQTQTPFDVQPCQITVRLSDTAAGGTVHPAGIPGWMPFGAAPAAGDAFYLGFDARLQPAGSRVRLFALGEDPAGDERTWRALHALHIQTRLTKSTGCRRSDPCAQGFWQHPGVRVAWEYFDGSLWQALPGLFDATRALSLSGPIRFRVPADMQAGGLPNYANTWFIRCRITAGEFDCPPRLGGLFLNAVLARHAADNPPRRLGTSTGHAQQRFELSRQPIVPGSTEVTLTLADGTEHRSQERPDFDRSGGLVRYHRVDEAMGEIVFGDGRKGRVPEAGAVISVRWRTGGGTSGNLPAGSLVTTVSSPRLAVLQPVAAWGGTEAESLGEAKARAVRELAQARCAVTLQDFERVAVNVPGAPVARAKAVAEFHPQLHRLPAAGCVTVVILSPCASSRPHPTPALCEAVRRQLEACRPVATEVHVTGPDWTTVSVRARLRTRRGETVPGLADLASQRINAFLDPLHGGPDGTGWPFGRPVFRTEILALLNALPGVLAVDQLALVQDEKKADHCHNIALCPHGLVRSGPHSLTLSPETTR